jgi:hypothetical protein
VEENGMENTRVVLTGVTPGGEYKVAEDETSRRGAYKVDRGRTSPRGVKRPVGAPYNDGSQPDNGSLWPWNW